MSRALLVITGDELLRGFVQDANSRTIANDLRKHGIDLNEVVFTSDSADAIENSIARGRAAHSPDIVVVTGGLGPTHDDRTSEVVARHIGVLLEVDARALQSIEDRVATLGRNREFDPAVFAAGNRKQAMLPQGAVWFTPIGTAPGYVVQSDETLFVVLPGPPAELRAAWKHVLQSKEFTRYSALYRDGGVRERETVLRIWGRPEAFAANVLEDLEHEDTDACRVTLCARDGELELSIRGSDAARVEHTSLALQNAFEEYLFAVNDERHVSAIVGELLTKHELQLAVAESCTGGLLGSIVTSQKGSSEYFIGGVISYSNSVKEAALGVSSADLAEHGAVSEPVAIQMAQGAQRRLGANVGIGITGVAGPGGGTQEKPVGTVCIAIAVDDDVNVRTWSFVGDRDMVRSRSCAVALHSLRKLLEHSNSVVRR